MSEDVWSARDTTPDAIEAALRSLLRERYAANRALAPARVLSLVVVVDREWKGEIANRLERVGRYHASRTVLCAVEDGRDTLDAVAVMSYEEPRPGSIGVMRESVEIDMGPGHLRGLDTIVDPVIASELPTVVWSPHRHDDAVEALRGRGMIDVMLLDSDDTVEPTEGLERGEQMLESAYVVDLAWLRTTPWRERLAASFDPADRRGSLSSLEGVTVRHQPSSAASALLLAGWLSSRLGWEPQALEGGDGQSGWRGVAVRSGGSSSRQVAGQGSGQGSGEVSRQVEIELEPVDQEVPGLAGVTVRCDGFSLSLDRARGGLRASERFARGGEREWQVLGASRGEGGILGEGVRQALLRDPTYGPALYTARRFAGGG